MRRKALLRNNQPVMSAVHIIGSRTPQSHTFCVADFRLRIVFDTANDDNSMELLPSFAPFVAGCVSDTLPLLFTLTVADGLPDCEFIEETGCFDTGNGDIIVHSIKDGGYHYEIKNISGDVCCRLLSNGDFSQCQCVLYGSGAMRSQGLNNALMLMFAFASCPCDTLLIHASCVVAEGKAYPFIAKSGTGKSTHSSLWLKNIADTHLLNDDNPILRIVNGTVMVYGSPWSGKTPCYRQEKFPAGAIVKISRAKVNSIERNDTIYAFAAMLPACSTMKTDKHLHGMLCETIGKVISYIPVYTMHCLPDNEAALICHNQVSRQ